MGLHWDEEMFEIGKNGEVLFWSEDLKNEGFVVNENVIGLELDFEGGG